MPAAAARCTRVGEQEPAALPPEQHVRGDVQVVAERQVLPDHRDPAPQHRRRVGGHRPASQEYLPGSGRHVTGDAAHQRGLARPVLTGQRHQLARPEAQVDVVQRPQRPEPGGEPLDGQQRPDPVCTGGATLAAIATLWRLSWPSGQGPGPARPRRRAWPRCRRGGRLSWRKMAASTPPGADARPAAARPAHRGPVLIALMVTMALAAMDTTIVSTAIPQVVARPRRVLAVQLGVLELPADPDGDHPGLRQAGRPVGAQAGPDHRAP